MQLDIRGHRVHVTPMLCRHIVGRRRPSLSRFGPREAAWDPYGKPYRRQLEIKSWVRLHHLELMKSYGRSVAHNNGRSKATGTSHVTAHLVTEYS